MKKLTTWIVIVVMLVCAGYVVARPYEVKGVVVADKGSIVEVTLDNGYSYEVEVDPFYFHEGDRIIASVDEVGSPSPKDDRIVDLRKLG